jgi:pimeloyl-ACP methyl ester carboxylesterase
MRNEKKVSGETMFSPVVLSFVVLFFFLKKNKVWTLWEGCTSHLVTSPGDLDRFEEDKFALAFASIENHYFTNGGFFERDGFLLEPQQLAKIKDIPCTIVQGRYDVVCPIETAYLLHKGVVFFCFCFVLVVECVG